MFTFNTLQVDKFRVMLTYISFSLQSL